LCAEQTLLDHLAALLIDEAQEVGVFVAYVQSGCHLRLYFATITHGPILLSILGILEPVERLQTQRVLRIWGVGLLISSSENCVNSKFAEFTL
jgi:hypothetical protein